MSKKASILVIQGPNLNLLGTREPEVYGKTTLADIHQKLEDLAKAQSVDLGTYQSNHEGELIDRIQKAKQDGVDFIIINPAAFTHTSVALRDALSAIKVPSGRWLMVNRASRIRGGCGLCSPEPLATPSSRQWRDWRCRQPYRLR